MKETKYFMIRPINSSPEMINNFLCNSIVAVGWSDIDLSKKFCLEDLFLDLKINPLNEMPPQAAGRHRDQIVRFLSIVEEDKIIVPVNDCICLAIATKQRKYNKEQINNNQANEIVVNYLRNKNEEILYIPRSSLSEDLQRRLRVRGITVISLNEFSEEIERYFKKGII